MHSRLLVFQADIEGQDVRVLDTLRHVRVSAAVVEDKTPHELSLGRRPMLHLHDLNHMEIDRFTELLWRVYKRIQWIRAQIPKQ